MPFGGEVEDPEGDDEPGHARQPGAGRNGPEGRCKPGGTTLGCARCSRRDDRGQGCHEAALLLVAACKANVPGWQGLAVPSRCAAASPVAAAGSCTAAGVPSFHMAGTATSMGAPRHGDPVGKLTV